MACTGIEYCKLAIVETKARRPSRGRTHGAPATADIDADITINVNGCPNACARTQVADIGLKGQLVAGPDGGAWWRASRSTSAAALGHGAGQNAGFGRKLRGLKTTAEELTGYVERVARNYLAEPDRGRGLRPVGVAGRGEVADDE